MEILFFATNVLIIISILALGISFLFNLKEQIQNGRKIDENEKALISNQHKMMEKIDLLQRSVEQSRAEKSVFMKEITKVKEKQNILESAHEQIVARVGELEIIIKRIENK